MNTPLHLACYHLSDDKWAENIREVKLMVDLCPDVLNARTKSFTRPLDRAEMNKLASSERALESFTVRQPKETA